jgi:hypothetical protein
MERRQITVRRLNPFLAIGGCLLLVCCAFISGYTLAKNERAVSEFRVMIPMGVKTYDSIKEGDVEQAANLTAISLSSKVLRYESMKDTFFFRVVGGEGLSKSVTFQQSLQQAKNLLAVEMTNMVTIKTRIEVE